ncbi:hypothetical protein LX32DRAFT_643261 [Colletotrichum zoysiae]|uniref:Secreted protein n=1 Tax=Colletotrichum zoysiae TaxID=1216348 RepID=A0AAD9HAK7_9PEZI|nr:hypothetical protein LX32DRAFT_643261 [Colletotrichum zoysiae]
MMLPSCFWFVRFEMLMRVLLSSRFPLLSGTSARLAVAFPNTSLCMVPCTRKRPADGLPPLGIVLLLSSAEMVCL